MSFDTMMVTLCCLALAYGAAHDIAARTIPNAVSLGIGAAGVVQAIRHQELLPALAIASAIFLAGLVAWRASLLGGGDVKLLTAISLWIRPEWEPTLLLEVSIAGGLLACVYLALGSLLPARAMAKPRGLARRAFRVEQRRIRNEAPLPYAVAIAAASIICFVQQ